MRLAIACCMTCVAATAIFGSTGLAVQPADSPAADVLVTVSVRENSRAVTGLTTTDFVVTDNGEPQSAKVVPFDSVPIDATLVIDTRHGATALPDRLAGDLQQVARLLRKDDRLRVLRVDTFVEELQPLSAAASKTLNVTTGRSNGLSSLHDALIAALVRPSAPNRAQLVVAITDGSDSMSAATADRVREVAARSEALLQIAGVRPPAPGRAAPSVLRPRFRDASLLILAEAAEQTGGELRTPGLFSDADVVSAFTRAFDEFRQGYVLRYAPANVEREGWHELSVTVPRAPNATVRAKRGYYSN